MKIHARRGQRCLTERRRKQIAFTLVEVLIASTIVLMVIGAVLATNLFGVRVMQITQPKLNASAGVRQMMNSLVSEITSAKTLLVGTGDVATFTRVADGAPKQGNAVQLYPSTDTNIFIRYFRDATDKRLKRVTNGATNVFVMSNAVTNSVVFTGEDSLGNILTNNQNNLVVGVTLQFSQLGGTNMPVGPTNYYKSYQLTTRIVHRPR